MLAGRQFKIADRLAIERGDSPAHQSHAAGCGDHGGVVGAISERRKTQLNSLGSGPVSEQRPQSRVCRYATDDGQCWDPALVNRLECPIHQDFDDRLLISCSNICLPLRPGVTIQVLQVIEQRSLETAETEIETGPVDIRSRKTNPLRIA